MKKLLLVVLTAVVFGGLYWYSANAPTENETNAVAYKDLLRIESPLPNTVITSPLVVKGEARGPWYFEASFPVQLLDENGVTVPLDPPYIMTANDWMTEEFVSFEATLTFSVPQTETGTLIIHKDNPSGLPEHDDSFSIPVRFR